MNFLGLKLTNKRFKFFSLDFIDLRKHINYLVISVNTISFLQKFEIRSVGYSQKRVRVKINQKIRWILEFRCFFHSVYFHVAKFFCYANAIDIAYAPTR